MSGRPLGHKVHGRRKSGLPAQDLEGSVTVPWCWKACDTKSVRSVEVGAQKLKLVPEGRRTPSETTQKELNSFGLLDVRRQRRDHRGRQTQGDHRFGSVCVAVLNGSAERDHKGDIYVQTGAVRKFVQEKSCLGARPAW